MCILQVYTYTLARLTVCAATVVTRSADYRQAQASPQRVTKLGMTLPIVLMQAPGELPSLTFAVPVAAGLAGVVLSFVLSPFELVKVQWV